MSPLIFKIQKFSVHDGPGIRTTVFFKGCPLRCQWCHNPESQTYDDPDSIARAWQLDELVTELMKDRIFYDESGGGVTLSGGEPLAQEPAYIYALAKKLHTRGVRLAIDTCGDVPWECFFAILPFTDMFLYDIKSLDDKKHWALAGASNERILQNLIALGQENVNICLRLPLMGGVNDSLTDAEQLVAWLAAENVCPYYVNLLPYHDYGGHKYSRLGWEKPDFTAPSQTQLDTLLAYWQSCGYRAGVGGGILRG